MVGRYPVPHRCRVVRHHLGSVYYHLQVVNHLWVVLDRPQVG